MLSQKFISSYLNRDDSFPLNNGLLVVVVVVVVLFLPDSLDLKLFRIMGLNLEEDEPRFDVLDDFVRDGDGVVDVLSLNFSLKFSFNSPTEMEKKNKNNNKQLIYEK